MSQGVSPRSRFLPLAGALAIASIAASANAEAISGATGSSPLWGSGWIDLAPPMDFKKGEKLKIRLGGSAEKILVRLLPRGAPSDSDTGIVGEPIMVPKSREVEVLLPLDRKQIAQISVHGGPNPWGRYPLGGGNGPATISSIELVK